MDPALRESLDTSQSITQMIANHHRPSVREGRVLLGRVPGAEKAELSQVGKEVALRLRAGMQGRGAWARSSVTVMTKHVCSEMWA